MYASEVADRAQRLIEGVDNPARRIEILSAYVQDEIRYEAIEFGTSVPSTMTLRDMTFTNFDADTTNGAALNFLDTADVYAGNESERHQQDHHARVLGRDRQVKYDVGEIDLTFVHLRHKPGP